MTSSLELRGLLLGWVTLAGALGCGSVETNELKEPPLACSNDGYALTPTNALAFALDDQRLVTFEPAGEQLYDLVDRTPLATPSDIARISGPRPVELVLANHVPVWRTTRGELHRSTLNDRDEILGRDYLAVSGGAHLCTATFERVECDGVSVARGVGAVFHLAASAELLAWTGTDNTLTLARVEEDGVVRQLSFDERIRLVAVAGERVYFQHGLNELFELSNVGGEPHSFWSSGAHIERLSATDHRVVLIATDLSKSSKPFLVELDANGSETLRIELDKSIGTLVASSLASAFISYPNPCNPTQGLDLDPNCVQPELLVHCWER